MKEVVTAPTPKRSLPRRQLRNWHVALHAVVIPFTAAQAAQKVKRYRHVEVLMFTAAQAAQKVARDRVGVADLFTAAQAAQKPKRPISHAAGPVHCRAGSSENDPPPLSSPVPRSLPRRQLRNNTLRQDRVALQFTAAQAAQKSR